jgi:ABC-type nitrate/sulfonate/bicarbonate transport system permease component
MLGLPTDVLQAARVDGATEWGTFVRIVLPMSRSAIITVAGWAYYWVGLAPDPTAADELNRDRWPGDRL